LTAGTDHPERLAASRDLDRLPTLELVRLLQSEEARVPAAVAGQSEAITAAVEGVVARLHRGGRLFYLGAGTSARIAQLDAAELPPTFGTPPEWVQLIAAGGEAALLRAAEGAEDDAQAAADEVDRRVRGDDAVVGLAASGNTPFTVAGVRRARLLGAFTVAVTARPKSPLALAAEVAIVPETGPEVILGSTRLKAGTAQKLVLNTLSTAVMVRLGRVYSNLMVEMPATNAKLAGRARTMVALAAGVPTAVAAAALAASGGAVKPAIVMARLGLDATEAAARLAAAGGSLRRALGEAAAGPFEAPERSAEAGPRVTGARRSQS
jgi:N-acetylmuramic acid 6-phosphate etherase